MRVLDIFSDHVVTKQPTQQIEESEPMDQNIKPSEPNPEDRITMDVPLLLRVMEYAKEDAKTDMDLHRVADNLVKLSAGGQTLDMSNYNHIVGGMSESGSPAEEFLKNVEYQPAPEQDPEYSIKKIVARGAEGMPVTRFVIVDQHGERVSDAFDSLASAKFYLNNKFNQQTTTEGYGRYWCSTDKRWKERQGPKQSRS